MSKDSAFHHDTGKGSRPRPYEVSQEEFTKKFDAIDWSVKVDKKESQGIAESWLESTSIDTVGIVENTQWKIDAEGNTTVTLKEQ